MAGVMLPALVGNQVAVADAAVRAHLVEGQIAPFEEAHQKRPRHVQHVGCLLRRQLGMDGNDGHGVAGGNLGQHVHQQPDRGRRQLKAFCAAGGSLSCFNTDGAILSGEVRQRAARLSRQDHLGVAGLERFGQAEGRGH